MMMDLSSPPDASRPPSSTTKLRTQSLCPFSTNVRAGTRLSFASASGFFLSNKLVDERRRSDRSDSGDGNDVGKLFLPDVLKSYLSCAATCNRCARVAASLLDEGSCRAFQKQALSEGRRMKR